MKEEHQREHRRTKERQRIYGFKEDEITAIHHNLMVEDSLIGLYEQVDTVITLKTGEIIPLDVKYTDFDSVKLNWKKQLVAYSILLESHFKRTITRGIIYFPIQKKEIILPIQPEDKKSLIKDIYNIKELIQTEKIPTIVHGSQCNYCEMKKFCP